MTKELFALLSAGLVALLALLAVLGVLAHRRRQRDVEPPLPWIDAAPTLVVGGTRDALVPAKVIREVLRARPDWHGHVLDDRRHVLMLEDPEGYLELVDRWHAESAA